MRGSCEKITIINNPLHYISQLHHTTTLHLLLQQRQPTERKARLLFFIVEREGRQGHYPQVAAKVFPDIMGVQVWPAVQQVMKLLFTRQEAPDWAQVEVVGDDESDDDDDDVDGGPQVAVRVVLVELLGLQISPDVQHVKKLLFT